MHVGMEMESSGDVRLGFLHGGSVYVFARLENEVFDHCVGQSFSAPLCQLAGQCPNCLLPVISASLDDYGSVCNHPGQRGRSDVTDYASVKKTECVSFLNSESCGFIGLFYLCPFPF